MMEKFIRQPAVKVNIQNLNSGKYVEEDDQTPNYLQLEDKKIYRINLIATIVDKELIGNVTSAILDDGSGSIPLRSFDNPLNQEVGSVVLVIGKLRIYNQQKYISPEIVKEVDKLWLKVRSIELPKVDEIVNIPNTEDVIEDFSDVIVEPTKGVVELIKKMDQGDGVLIEEIISTSQQEDIEEIIEKMLESGEIFQNQPGKVKVL